MNNITGRQFLLTLDAKQDVVIFIHGVVYEGELGKMQYYQFLKIADKNVTAISYNQRLLIDFNQT